MKKVFLSLAIVAALTVVSCKQAEGEVEATADSTAAVVEETVEAIADTATATIDSTAAAATEAVEAATEEVKK